MKQYPPRFPGMKAWVCTYRVGGQVFGITLYASDPDQIESDNPSVMVEGELLFWMEAENG